MYKGLTYGILTERQKKKLDEIGMRWGNISDANWERNFAAAKKYYQDNGNLLVKAQYKTEDGIRLGAWLSNIRTCVSNGREEQLKSITPARKAMLDSIGMSWRSRYDDLWFSIYKEAKKYFAEHGNLDVPTMYKNAEGTQLGRWIVHQREYRKKDKLSEEQIALLENIDMRW